MSRVFSARLEVAQIGMAAPAAPRWRLAAPRPHRSTVQYAEASAAPRSIHLDHDGHPPTYLRDLLAWDPLRVDGAPIGQERRQVLLHPRHPGVVHQLLAQ